MWRFSSRCWSRLRSVDKPYPSHTSAVGAMLDSFPSRGVDDTASRRRRSEEASSVTRVSLNYLWLVDVAALEKHAPRCSHEQPPAVNEVPTRQVSCSRGQRAQFVELLDKRETTKIQAKGCGAEAAVPMGGVAALKHPRRGRRAKEEKGGKYCTGGVYHWHVGLRNIAKFCFTEFATKLNF